ncbi:hypothetical protein HQ529_06700, partial [Candidatus Woesearchaeota archaeon]|nr:hypothetical protein [Candidatus Woesearchaeota archaeon]
LFPEEVNLFGEEKGISTFSAYAGSATRAYTMDDFIWAKKSNLINNPIGIGIVISLLFILSVGYIFFRYKQLAKKKNSWITTSLIWFIITFLLVNSATFNLPIGIFAFRTWLLMAVPISILCTEGLFFLFRLSSKYKIGKAIILILLVLAILQTSFSAKYTVNTANWYAGNFKTPQEIGAYVWLKTLPLDTKVFTFALAVEVTGFNKYICIWCDDEYNILQKGITGSTPDSVYNFLKRNNYEYFIVGASDFLKYGTNQTNDLLMGLLNSNKVTPAQNFENGAVILKVV